MNAAAIINTPIIPFYQFVAVLVALLVISAAPAIVIAWRTVKALHEEANDMDRIAACNARDVERMIAKHGNTTY